MIVSSRLTHDILVIWCSLKYFNDFIHVKISYGFYSDYKYFEWFIDMLLFGL